MKYVKTNIIILYIIIFLGNQTIFPIESVQANQPNNNFSDIQATHKLTDMPLFFTENQGQWDDIVQFRANSVGATMWFGSDAAYYQFTRIIESEISNSFDDVTLNMSKDLHQVESYETMLIKAKFIGANKNPQMVGVDMIDYKCNYYLGNDQSKWATNVPNYNAVLYEEIYDGIDLKYYDNGKQQMEYDFIVSPGADFSQIKIQYEGVESIAINNNGELIVTTMWGEVVEQRPVIYQVENNKRVPIDGSYIQKSDNSFGFALSSTFDSSIPLVIDPVLSYSTYLGGNQSDFGTAITVDASGAAYVTGHSSSTNFPMLNPYQIGDGSTDIFITKLNSSGTGLVYSTYLGGSSSEAAGGIAVDASGVVYLSGRTSSADFPTHNPYQGTLNGDAEDAFVVKISSGGDSLIYSTYLGGNNTDYVSDIAIDALGSAYVIGATVSTDFPTYNPYQGTILGATWDVFITKLNSSGDSLAYSTYLGGSGSDWGHGIAVDGLGFAYVVGYTYSSNFPTLNAYQGSKAIGKDVFVAKLSSAGNSLIYSTYIGGNDVDAELVNKNETHFLIISS